MLHARTLLNQPSSAFQQLRSPASNCYFKSNRLACKQVGTLFRQWFAGLSKQELEAKILEVFRQFDEDGSGCVHIVAAL